MAHEIDVSGVYDLIDELKQLKKEASTPVEAKVKVNNQASKELQKIQREIDAINKNKITITNDISGKESRLQRNIEAAKKLVNSLFDEIQKDSEKTFSRTQIENYIHALGVLDAVKQRNEVPNFKMVPHISARSSKTLLDDGHWSDSAKSHYYDARKGIASVLEKISSDKNQLQNINSLLGDLQKKADELKATILTIDNSETHSQNTSEFQQETTAIEHNTEALKKRKKAANETRQETSAYEEQLNVLEKITNQNLSLVALAKQTHLTDIHDIQLTTESLQQVTEVFKQETKAVEENTKAQEKNTKAKSKKKSPKSNIKDLETTLRDTEQSTQDIVNHIEQEIDEVSQLDAQRKTELKQLLDLSSSTSSQNESVIEQETAAVEENTEAVKKNSRAKSKKTPKKSQTEVKIVQEETQEVEKNTEAQEINTKAKSKSRSKKTTSDSSKIKQETVVVQENTDAIKANSESKSKKTSKASTPDILPVQQETSEVKKNTEAIKENTRAKKQNATIKSKTKTEKKSVDVSQAEKNSSISTNEEASAVNKAGKAFEQTANAKRKYKKANEEVDDANKTSSKSISEEEKELKRLLKTAEKSRDKLKNLDWSQYAFKPDALTNVQKTFNDLSNKDLKPLALGELKEYVKNVTDFFDSIKIDKLADPKKISSMMSSIGTVLSSNSNFSQDAKKSITAYYKELQSGAPISVRRLKEIGVEIDNITSQEKILGHTGNNVFTSFAKQLQSANAQLLTMFFSWQDWIRYARTAFDTVHELDTELIDLKKTTAMNSDELADFYRNSSDVAREMGNTTKGIIDQAAAWSRLGYNTKEQATEMAKLSSQFASISPGMNVEDAQTGLVSIMKAWDVDVDKVERDIMDNINTLGNKFAEDNSDIISGMERAGATFAAIGMSIEDSFALFTGAQEVIQNAEVVGTALKTLSLRIRGYDEDTEQLSEDVVKATGKVASLTQVASNGYSGISLWKDASQTEYKSLVQYLGEISEIWDEIDAKSQTQLLDSLFGKRGASVGSAIIKNFDQVKKALEEMEGAAGSADREMNTIRESLDYKLNNLKETWVGIVKELMDSGQLGQLIDALTKISEALGWIIEKAGPLGIIIGGLTIQKTVSDLNKTHASFVKISEVLAQIFTSSKSLNEFISLSSKAVGSTFSKGLQNASIAAGTFNSAILAIAKNPLTWKLIALAFAIGAVKKAWDTANVTVKETQDKIDTINNNIDSLSSEISELQSINNPTASQKERLKLLESELAIKKDLLKVEEERQYAEKIGTKFTDKFDPDNWHTKIDKYKSQHNPTPQSLGHMLDQEFKKTAINGYRETVSDIEHYQEIINSSRYSKNEKKAARTKQDRASKNLEAFRKDLEKDYQSALNDYQSLQETSIEIEAALKDAKNHHPERVKDLQGLSDEYKNQLEDLRTHVVELDGLLGYNSSISVDSRLNSVNQNVVGENAKDLKILDEYTKDFSIEQKEAWINVVTGARNAQQAIEKYKKSLENTSDKTPALSAPEFTVKDFSEEFTAKLADIQKEYSSFYENVVNGKDKVADLDSIEGLRKNLVAVDNQLGVTEEEFKDFEKVVGNSSSSISEKQAAWNQLSTQFANAYFDEATKGLKSVDEETKQLIKDQIVLKGYTEESVDAFVDEKVNSKNITDALASRLEESLAIINDYKEKGDEEIARQLQQAGQGGSVDLTLRPTVDTSKLKDAGWDVEEGNIATLFTNTFTNADNTVALNFTPILTNRDGTLDRILSPEELQRYAEEVIAGVHSDYLNLQIGAKFNGDDALEKAEEMAQKIHKLQDVYYGQSTEYSIADFIYEDISALDEEAEQLGITSEALAKYKADALIASNAIDTAPGRAQLAALVTSMGIAGEAAEKLRTLLDLLNGNEIISKQRRENIVAAIQRTMNEATKGINNVTINASTPKSGKGSGGHAGKEAADAYVEAYEKEVKKLDTQKEKGLLTERQYLEKLKALNEKYFKDNAKYAEKYAEVAADYAQKLLSHYNSVISGVTTLLSRKISALQKSKDAAIKSITAEKDATLKALNKEKEAMEAAYKSKMDAIQNEIDGHNEQIKTYQKQQKAINKVIKAKQKEIKELEKFNKAKQKEITAIEKENKVKEKQKKQEEKFIKEQQKVIKINQKEIDSRNKQVEALQEQIDALNKVNEARKDSIEMQKAEYDLQRKMNQRTKLVYTGEQGQMRYEADESEVRNARENLDDKKEQAKVKAIQKKIDGLNEEIKSYNKIIESYQTIIDEHQEIIDGIDEYLTAKQEIIETLNEEIAAQQEIIDSINEYIESQQEIVDHYQELIDNIQESIDVLQEQKDALQKAMDKESEMYEKRIKETEEMYAKMQEDAEKYWDALIDKLETTKSKWEELAEVETVAKAWHLVADEMAQFGFTVDDVLNDVPGAFDKFKDVYIKTLSNMNGGTDQWKNAVQYAAKDAQTNYEAVKSSIEAGKSATDELVTATSGLQTAASNVDTFATSLTDAGTATSDLKTASEGLATNFTDLANTKQGILDLTQALRDIQTEIENKTTAFEDESTRVSAALTPEIEMLSQLNAKLAVITEKISHLSEDTDLSSMTGQFNDLANAIKGVSDNLQGSDKNSILSSLQEIAKIDIKPLIEDFDALTDSINTAVGSISGGGGAGKSDKGGEQSGNKGDKGGGQGASGTLISSIEETKKSADQNIGVTSTDEGATVIGDVNQLGLAVKDVLETKIGLTGASADDGTFIGGIVGLHEKADKHIGKQKGDTGTTIIGDFNQLGQEVTDVSENHVGKSGDGSDKETLVGSVKAVSEETTKDIAGTATDDFHTLHNAVVSNIAKVKKLHDELDSLVENSPYKVTIEIETKGAIPHIGVGSNFTGTATTGQAYATGSAHVEGTAKMEGDWGVQQGGRSLVGELGQELVVRNGRFFTVGDNGPQFITLQPNDVIFNHLQTRQLLSKKNLVMPRGMNGKAFASGSASSAMPALSQVPKTSATRRLQEKLQGLLSQAVPAITNLSNVIEKQTNFLKRNPDRFMQKSVSTDEKPNVTINNPQFNVSGVTGEQVTRQIESEFEGLMLSAYQKSLK